MIVVVIAMNLTVLNQPTQMTKLCCNQHHDLTIPCHKYICTMVNSSTQPFKTTQQQNNRIRLAHLSLPSYVKKSDKHNLDKSFNGRKCHFEIPFSSKGNNSKRRSHFLK